MKCYARGQLQLVFRLCHVNRSFDKEIPLNLPSVELYIELYTESPYVGFV